MTKSHTQTPQPKKGAPTALIWALIAGVGFIAAILIVISVETLTSKESTLLGTLLTLLAVGIGWGVSHYYASMDKAQAVAEVREFEQRNLRTYALKAAEKVTNLSKELSRLSTYLQEELQYTEYRSAEEELFAKEERIESAIHILGSLRSINDTSLSDWQGVIGAELDEQRQTEEVRAEALGELTDRLAALERASTENVPVTEDLEIKALKREVRALAADINGISFRPKKARPPYQEVVASCPACNVDVSFRLRERDGEIKAVQCKHCESNLIAEYREDNGVILRQRQELPEPIHCPECNFEFSVDLDEWPSASSNATCPQCQEAVRVSRADAGKDLRVVLRQPKALQPVTPEIIDRVRQALPTQPWPKGVHQSVAAQLQLKPQTVQKAMQHLIRIGEFSDQVDGVLCTTAEKLALIRSAGQHL
ncbi:hypothetical protein [Burkholderia sp. 9120]|uniref:hypothetical protein n=1 Tax=Burkholderia sp. 9120 TaxID=1500897 RepID=UPI0012E01205|nr:hypothetical protein [Burkholderia sp. 9120]